MSFSLARCFTDTKRTAFRSPDQFNNIVNIFLFSEPESIRDSLLGSLDIPNERIVVTDINGNDYEINRFCPHQGADLNAEINNNNELICPRHGWRFDLTRFEEIMRRQDFNFCKTFRKSCRIKNDL